MIYRDFVPTAWIFVFSAMVFFYLLASPVQAREDHGGFICNADSQGFQGPGPRIMNVQDVKNMPDDTNVALRGNIIQHLGGDEYAFQDATGTITVDIDNKRWRGQTITPQDLVELTGEVDREWGAVKIDIKSVTKVK